MSDVAIIGAGPAGLMAAEILSASGMSVAVYDRMPSVGRKLLMAGRGGLNLTHSEDFQHFVTRYSAASARLKPLLDAYPPQAVMEWAEGLGQPVFTGTSGRIFPKAMKASPLLRVWLARLAQNGVRFRLRHEWLGWDDAMQLKFRAPEGLVTAAPKAALLALGGASWPRLGSDGSWVGLLRERGVAVVPLKPANCGVTIAWSDVFRERFQGAPLKRIRLSAAGQSQMGEAVVTASGLEGGAVYALSGVIRDALEEGKKATLAIDLKPDLSMDEIAAKLRGGKRGETQSNHLRKALGLQPVQINLLREAAGKDLPHDDAGLAHLVKHAALTVTGTQGLPRAISTAGGIAFDELDEHLMLKKMPGVYAAGEMLDWEAPTGGYLLQACLATGVATARGILQTAAASR